jgi:hypothetical protein
MRLDPTVEEKVAQSINGGTLFQDTWELGMGRQTTNVKPIFGVHQGYVLQVDGIVTGAIF